MNVRPVFRLMVKWLIRLPLMCYAALLLLGWLGSEGMIFVPPPPGYRGNDPDGGWLVTSDGAKISAMLYTNPAARFTILFSHGNAEDLGTVRYDLEELQGAGFNVFGYDYRGYGTSEGRPSERNAYRDIEAAYNHLTMSGIDPSNIIVMGRSVGSGPSVDLASRKPVGGLIIQSGFVSAFRVMTHAQIVPFDRFNNLAKMPNVRCPVLIIHGTTDTIIAPWHGEKLYDAARGPKQIVRILGAGHNDLIEVAGTNYLQAIRSFASTL